MSTTADEEKTPDIQDSLHLLHEALEAGAETQVQDLIATLHPSQIADVLESLPPNERGMVWELVRPDIEGEVLSECQDKVRAGLLEDMAPREVAAVTQHLDTDDAADILQDLPEPVVDEVLLAMDEQNRQRLASVLTYSEDTAGGLMNTDVVTVRADVILDVVSRYLRLRGAIPEKTDQLMVVDREGKYLGVLPLSEVLIRDPEATVGELMVQDIEGIPASLPAVDVAKLFEQRDLVSAAVVNEAGVLLGRITIDDVVDVIQERADHSLMSLAGLGEEDDMFAPIVVSTRRRAVWLGINLATCFLAAWVIGRFEATIQQLVALAVLMPIVASMGGIAGVQTLTIAIRGIAVGQLGAANAPWLMLKELVVGLFNGLIWAMVVGGIVILWYRDVGLGLIIGLAMVINLLAAAASGALIPLALKRLGVDPAIAGGVILTTVTDVVGFMAFLGLASLFLIR
ncbi:MAG: magnesium transporter [Gammaproteobacteria bacterium]|nr:magnesium transporter [Gammaproteobacteria bacterium]MCI0590504.1 magnesium transporter [Gammaproteobacteria bacterium]